MSKSSRLYAIKTVQERVTHSSKLKLDCETIFLCKIFALSWLREKFALFILPFYSVVKDK